MTITLSSDVEAKAREKAAAAGVSVESYIAHLIVEDQWQEIEDDLGDEDAETYAAVMEGLEQIERGEFRPAEEVFAEIRARRGFPR